MQEMAIGLAVLGAAMPEDAQHDDLLKAYITLCSDRVWAVRKACADILPEMAKLASAEMRETQLLPVFDKFCEDVSHWVQNSALQQLGPFISMLPAHNIPESKSQPPALAMHLLLCLSLQLLITIIMFSGHALFKSCWSAVDLPSMKCKVQTLAFSSSVDVSMSSTAATTLICYDSHVH